MIDDHSPAGRALLVIKFTLAFIGAMGGLLYACSDGLIGMMP